MQKSFGKACSETKQPRLLLLEAGLFYTKSLRFISKVKQQSHSFDIISREEKSPLKLAEGEYALENKSRFRRVIKKGIVVLLCMVVLLVHPVAIIPVKADGTNVDLRTESTNPVDHGKPGQGSWPPAGTQPKGPFVAGAFAGTWYAFVDNTAFTLVIQQEGQILKIAHTAIYDYGRRVDSSVGGVSMAGAVNGSLAYVEWKSGLSPENGRATLEYMPGNPVSLHWKIVDAPKKPDDQADNATPTEVAYFLPATAYMIRK